MPIYEYACLDCGHREEVIQKVSEAALTECSSCGGRFEKQISAPAFQFKGSGFYETDYKRSSGKTDAIADAPKGESEKKNSQPEKSTPKNEGLAS